uniref:Uncharacterized protein n=1 Tax=Arundo donax TaxID=35708 RepID=A0A0A9D671_ARUDO
MPGVLPVVLRAVGVPWHAGVSRAEVALLGEGDSSREDPLLLEAAREGTWNRCRAAVLHRPVQRLPAYHLQVKILPWEKFEIVLRKLWV